MPFQILVHMDHGGGNRQPVDMPSTIYHDARILACALAGRDAESTLLWLDSYAPDPTTIRSFAASSRARLRERESATDVKMIDRVTAVPDLHARSQFSVNHPARAVLRLVAEDAHVAVGATFSDSGDSELLDDVRTPVEPYVLNALGLPERKRDEWVVRGDVLDRERMVRSHLDWYRERPEVLKAGALEHAERLELLALS